MNKNEKDLSLIFEIIFRLQIFYVILLFTFIVILMLINIISSFFNGHDVLKSTIIVIIIIVFQYYIILNFYKELILYKKLYLYGIPLKMYIVSIEEKAGSIDTPNTLIFTCSMNSSNYNEQILRIKKTFSPNPFEEGDLVEIIYLPENNKVGYFIDYCPYSIERRNELKKVC